jgi:FkbM family methyltransferase
MSNLKKNLHHVIKGLTPPVFWQFLSKAKLQAKRTHSANGIDLKIEKYLDHHGGYYVELGAADGIGFSNTLLFELHKGWKGVLVEPSPNNFLKCLENRSDKNQFFCNACTSFEYRERFVEMIYSHYMSTTLGIRLYGVDDAEAHALDGAKYLATEMERVFHYAAIARPLNELLIEAGAPSLIDFISLDVEGAEMEVLSGVDHAMFKFKLICVETRDIDIMTTYLNKVGYKYQEQISHHDYIFLLRA